MVLGKSNIIYHPLFFVKSSFIDY